MSTRLCKACGVVHASPWDRRCLNAASIQETQTKEGPNETGLKELTCGENDTHSALAISEILTSVKELNNRFTSYDKKFEALALKVNDPRQRLANAFGQPSSTVSKNPQDDDSVFTAPQRKDTDQSGIKPSVKHSNRPKYRYASDPGGEPPNKIVRVQCLTDVGGANERMHTSSTASNTSQQNTTLCLQFTHSLTSGHT